MRNANGNLSLILSGLFLSPISPSPDSLGSEDAFTTPKYVFHTSKMYSGEMSLVNACQQAIHNLVKLYL